MKKISYIITCCLIVSLFTSCQNNSNLKNSNKENNKNVVTNTNNSSVSVISDNDKATTDIKITTEGDKKYTDFPVHIESFYDLVEADEFIYYSSEIGIYKVNKKTGDSKLILKQKNVSKLVLSGKYLYFIDNSNNECTVSRIDTNGNDYSIVFNSEQLPYNENRYFNSLKIIGNMLYVYQQSLNLYSYNMGTNQLQLLIHNDLAKVNVVGDNIYYIDHAQKTFTIFRKNLKTMKTQIVLGEGKSHPKTNIYSDFVFVEDKLYYTNRQPNGIYCYSDGNTVTTNEKQPYYIDYLLFEYKKSLYYIECTNDRSNIKLIKYNPVNRSTSQVAILKDYSPGRDPIFANGYIYYYTGNGETKSVKISE